MANATLTSGAASVDFDTTAGTSYVFGLTGDFGGGRVTLLWANAATPTAFAAVPGGDFRQPWANTIVAPGSKLKMRLDDADKSGTSSVNAELTARA